MKKIYLLFISIILTSSLVGQNLDTNSVVIDPTITTEESSEIIRHVTQKWLTFVRSSTLSSELERDSFLLLFDFDAMHYVDFKETPIDMRMNVEEYVEETSRNYPTGMVFKVEDAKLTEIGVAQDFNFFAKIEMTKRYDEYLDLKKQLKFEESGLSSVLNIKFSIDPYQLDEAYISGIEGSYIEPIQSIVKSEPEKEAKSNRTNKKTNEKKKKKKKSPKQKKTFVTYRDSESIFSATLGGSIGSGSFSDANSILGDISNGVSYFGLPGLNLDFRRSFGAKQKLYFRIGLGAELGSYSTDISSFTHNSLNGYTNDAFISNSARSNSNQDNVLQIEGNEEINEAEIFILASNNASITDGVEQVSSYLIRISPGLSIKLFESSSSNSSLFLDLGGDVNFLLPAGSSNISYEGSIDGGVKIPTASLFPKETILADPSLSIIRDASGQLLSAYSTNVAGAEPDNINDLIGSTSNNLFYAASAGLSFQRKLNFGFGFELGAAYHFGLTPFVTESDNGGIGFLEQDLNDPRSASVVEQFYSDTSINRVSFRVGLYFKLNQD